MLTNPYFTLALAILSEVAATSALKASDGFTRMLPSGLAIAGYILAFYSLSLTLKGMSIGVAYAVWSGTGIVLLSTIDWLINRQKLDPAAIIGMALIIAGVVVINLFSRSVGR